LCTGTGGRQECSLSSILFNLHSEHVTKEALERFGYFKLGVKVIRAVEYADGLVLMAKEETVLQDIIDRLMEIKRCYGMELNMEKGGANRISRQLSPTLNIIEQV